MANLPKALQTIDKNYSQDVKNVAMYLVKPSPHKSIRQLLDTMGSRVLLEMKETQKYGLSLPDRACLLMEPCLHSAVDRLEAELMSELENGRLVRLLTKMGFINERPEYVSSNTSFTHPNHAPIFVIGSEGHIVGRKPATDTSSNSSETTSSIRWTKTSTRW